MAADDDNAGFTRDVGHPVSLAIKAFGDGDYAEAVTLLRPIRSIAYRFGGSHAQRDVIDLTLIEAAFRSRRDALWRPHFRRTRRSTAGQPAVAAFHEARSRDGHSTRAEQTSPVV